MDDKNAQQSTKELTRKRYSLVMELSELEEELNQRRQQDRHIMRVSEQEWMDVGETNPIKLKMNRRRTYLVTPELGFNVHNFDVWIVEVPPGSSEGAYHMHGEAVKYYLQGRGIENVGGKRYEVNAGDTVFIPANTWHGTENPGPETMRFLAMSHAHSGPLMVQAIYKTRKDLQK